MKDSKLTILLKSFPRKEIKEFEKFLESPYLNTAGGYVLKFFKVIKKFHPDFTDEKFSHRDIFKEIYPNEKFNDARMRKLVSETMKFALDFLAMKNYQDDENQKSKYMLKELDRRNMAALFEMKSKEFSKKLESNKLKDYEYYKNKHELLEIIKTYYFNRERKKAISLYDEEMVLLSKYFSLFFIHKFIERFMERKSFTEKEFKLPFFKEITNFSEENYLGKENLFDLYYTELMLHVTGDEKYYFSLKHIKEKLYTKINRNSLALIYFTLTNFATVQLEHGKVNFLNELFILHKEILKRKLEGTFFSEFLYNNILIIALRLNEVKFAEKFINDYRNKLRPDVREESYSLALANICFTRKKFSTALETLSRVSFPLPHHKYIVKNLTIKIYYEMNETDAIFSLTDSFKHILKRDKSIPQNVKIPVINFIGFVKDLLRVKSGEKKKEDLEARINREVTAEKLWLLSKVREFK